MDTDNAMMRSVVAGFVAVIFGLAITLLVELVIPTSNLTWAMIAVGFASFFAGVASYIAGYRDEEEIAVTA